MLFNLFILFSQQKKLNNQNSKEQLLLPQMNERNQRSQLVPFNYFVSMEHQMEESSVRETDKIKLKLIPAQTSEERKRNIIANVVVVEDESNGSGLVPYIDETITATNASQLHGGQGKHDKPRLRYYAVGPSTYRIKCPLCRQQGDAAVMRTAGLKDITCCLSMLSW